MKKIIIAIDGPAGCGKSSTAKALAKKLNYTYIDTGAMYRALTYYMINHHLVGKDRCLHLNRQNLENINITFVFDTNDQTYKISLDNHILDAVLRSAIVETWINEVSSQKVVRDFLIDTQQKMGEKGGVIMDGRDIGTAVFPQAELKIFLEASLEVRLQRRQRELRQNGIIESVKSLRDRLQRRDEGDKNNPVTPLKQANDSILINTDKLSFQEQVDRIFEKALSIIEK